MEEPKKTQELAGVQALRAVAALMVVAGHATDYLRARNGDVPSSLRWWPGPAGVDIFFIISGLVMMLSSRKLLRQAHPARIFLERRIIRILPLYWLLTALRVVLVEVKPTLSEHGAPPVWNIVASFLFIPSIGASGDIRPVIVVGWTLVFEMAFYYLFAWALTQRGRLLASVTGSVCLLAALGVVRTDAWPAWTAYADPIVLEFLAGVWLAHFLMKGWKLPFIVAVPCMVGGLICFGLFHPGPAAWQRALVWGSFALLTVAGTVSLEPSLKPRLPVWLILLGDASYSIYLVQVFLFPVLHRILEHTAPSLVQREPLEAGLLLMVTGVVVVSVAGVVLHRLVEKPLTEALRKATHTNRPAAVTP